MAAPFCIACGATIDEGTRFCVKCGKPVGQAAPPPPPPPSAEQETVFMPSIPAPPPVAAPPPIPTAPPVVGPPQVPAPPPLAAPPPIVEARTWNPPPPPLPPPVARTVPPQAVPTPPVKEGAGAGVWIGIFGILLLVGGAGLWLYTTRGPGFHASSTVQVAAEPTPQPPATPTPVPAPTPNPTTEVIPPNPDSAQKDPDTPKQPAEPALQAPEQPPAPAPTPSRAQPVQPRSVDAQPAAAPPSRPSRATSGVLHAAVEVAQNGEVVFENLPGARLRFTFDHSAWQPTISHQANGTQTLVMRSLKPGIQTTCDVKWEIVQ